MPECRGRLYVKNGVLTPVVQFDESALQREHYVYEVFRVIDGVALFLEDHLDRLYRTVELSGYPRHLVPVNFMDQVYMLIGSHSLVEGNIKVVVLPDGPNSPADFLIYIMEHQYPTDNDFTKGVSVGLYRGIRVNPNAKIMDTQLRSNANQAKQQNDVNETLLVDADNCITEGSRSNVFFVKNGRLVSPPLKDILPGITYKHVFLICNRLGISIIEERVFVSSLPEFDGVFTTGTSRKVLPVNKIGEFRYNPDLPIIRKIQAEFNDKVAEYIAGVKLLKTNNA